MTTESTPFAAMAAEDKRTTPSGRDEAVQPENHARAFSRIPRQDQATRADTNISVATPRKSRINPDDHRFVRLITVGVAFAGLVAFAISFVTLMEVATWLGLPEWMNWSVPAFIDTGILVYSGSVLIHKTRGEKTWASWLLLGTFTALSVVANAAHALTFGTAGDRSWQAIVGAVIAGMVPLAVFAATEQLSRVAVEDPVSRRRELEKQSEWMAAQAERERKQLEVEAEREKARQEAELSREEHVTQLEVVRAQREVLASRAAQAAEDGEALNLPAVPGLVSVPATQEEEPSQERRNDSEESVSRPHPKQGDVDAIIDFIFARTGRGEETSGADLASEFGFSDKTGRRRLASLRDSHPHIFVGVASPSPKVSNENGDAS